MVGTSLKMRLELCKHVVHVPPGYKCVHKTIASSSSKIVVGEAEPPEFRQMSRQPKIGLKMSASDSSRLVWVSFKRDGVFDSKERLGAKQLRCVGRVLCGHFVGMGSCTALRSELQHRRSIRSKHPHWLERWFGSHQCNLIHPIKVGSHGLKLADASESKTQEMPTRIRLC